MSDNDPLLGAALRALPVPDHGDRFRVPTVHVIPLLPFAAAAAGLGVVAAVVVSIAALSPSSASAADVRRAVAAALTQTHSFSARSVVSNGLFGGSGPKPYALTVGADGSYLVRGLAGTSHFVRAYDASTLTQTSVFTAAQTEASPFRASRGRPHRVYKLATGLDPGDVAPTLSRGYAGAVKALLAGHTAAVSKSTYEGRSAWRVDLRFRPGEEGFYGVGYRAVLDVDRATGLVLSYAGYLTPAPAPTTTIQIHDLQFDVSTPRSLFHVSRPAGLPIIREQWGFQPTTPKRAAALVGYRPYRPTDSLGMPLVTRAAATITGAGIPPSGTSPPPEVRHRVVSLEYGNSVPAFLNVSTRRYTASEGMPPADDLNDPFLFQISHNPHPVRLTAGAFAGRTAQISSTPLRNTVLWVAKDDLIVRIIASLPPSQVIEIANSLQPDY